MRTPAQWAISLVVVSFFTACSSDPVEQPDAATDGDADADADFEVALPVLTPCPDGWEEVPPEEEGGVTTCDPWPGSSPVFMTPCPDGWREVEDDGVVTCNPWPEGGPHECAEDEAHFPGEPTCSRIGTECPDGNWADDLPEDGTILYVLAGALAGGTGTRESPFGSINDALDVAEEGTIVALSRGTFDEALRLRTGITLWGACVAETVVTCSLTDEDTPVISVNHLDIRLYNLQVTGRGQGVHVSETGSVHLAEVVIADSMGTGWLVEGGIGTGHSVVVRDTRSLESNETLGRGLQVLGGARVEVRRTLIERNRDLAVLASDAGTAVTLSEVVVRDTQSRERDRRHGVGMWVQYGAQVDVSRSVFERNREYGLGAVDSGTALRMTDVIVRDTLGTEIDGMLGRGLEANAGAQVEANRALFEGNRAVAVHVFHSETTMILSDVVVRDTQSQESDGQEGHGLYAQNGAGVEVSRAVFERNRDVGVYAIHPGTTMIMSDVVVRDTQSRESDGNFGHGLHVQDRAVAQVRRGFFERNQAVGMIAFDPGTVLALSDVVVRDTQSRESDGLVGRGLDVVEGAEVEVTRAVFDSSREIGVAASDAGTVLHMQDVVVRDTQSREIDGMYGQGLDVSWGAEVEVMRGVFERNHALGVGVFNPGTTVGCTDLVVRDTQSQERDGKFGQGLRVQDGAHFEVSHAVLERNREVGVFVVDEDTEVVLEGVVVRETLPADCSNDDGCPEFGDGIISRTGAMLEVTDFVLSTNARCGVTVHHGSVDLHEGTVSDNTIGACINAEDFDLDRLMDNVVYRDNERRLDPNFNMPVPDPALPSDWENE